MSGLGQFVKGEHRSPKTEFVKGQTPWNKGGVNILVRGEKHGRWSGGKPSCLHCGIVLGSYTSKMCRECYKSSEDTVSHCRRLVITRGDKHGPNHHNWKGGITSADKSERTRFRREMQLRVLERDNYTCQICTQYSGSLQVDHIKSWKDNPDLRFDMDNCRTLCMACHYYVTFKKKLPQGVVWGHNLSRRIVS